MLFLINYFLIAHLPEQAENTLTSNEKIILRQFARTSDDNTEPLPVENDHSVLTFGDINFTVSKMLDAQSNCSDCKNIFRKLNMKSKTIMKQYKLIKNLIYKISADGKEKLVVPRQLAIEFLSYIHSLYVHPGIEMLTKIASKFVYIKRLNEISQMINKNCLHCIQKKPRKSITPDQIKPYAYECLPFSKCGIDLYDMGITDNNRKRFLLSLTCHLTSYVDGIPLTNKSDQQVAKAFTSLILRHGVCGDLILDNGGEFSGPIFKEVLKCFQINAHRSSAYNSRSNAKAERSHREILIKQKLIGSQRKNWSSHWPFIMAILNNTPKSNLNKLTPAECVYGRSLYFPLEWELSKPENLPKLPFTEAMSRYTSELWPALLANQMKRLKSVVSPTQKIKFNIGDFVLAYKPRLNDGKLSTLWQGPFKILKNYSNSSFILVDPETKTRYKRSVRHLRPIGHKINNARNKSKVI